GLFEEREEPADLAQRVAPVVALHTHRARNPLRRAEEVAEDGNRPARRRAKVALGMLEQERGPARLQHTVAQLGHLELRVDRQRDALQLAAAFELREEIAEV